MTRPMVREQEATALVTTIDDPVHRELVTFLLRRVQVSVLSGHALPLAPIDMAAIATAFATSTNFRAIVERILEGQTIAQATGWQFEED